MKQPFDGSNPTGAVLVIGGGVGGQRAALDLAELKTIDVAGMGATNVTGVLPKINGVQPFMSAQMHRVYSAGALVANSALVDSAGKVNQDTLGNNTKGAILSVRWDQWRYGYRRQMTFETTRYASADTTELVALTEGGLIYRDTEASAVSYNLTVS